MPDEQIVAPSATPEPTPDPVDRVVESGDLTAYRALRHAERTGKPLEVADTPADPAPATPVDQAASTDASTDKPASEPGTPAKTEARIKELLADRHRERERAERLERELSEIRTRLQPQTPPPAASSPAAAPETDPEPKIEDFENDRYPDPYSAYMRALAKWEGRQAAREEHRRLRDESQREAEQAERVKTIEQRNEGFRKRLAEEKERDPAWLDGISDEVKALRPFDALAPGETATGYNAIAEEIVGSEKASAFMRHFSEHPEDLHRIATLPPRLLIWQMGKLEARLEAPPPAVLPKTVTSAPPPPPTVGSRVTDPVDDTQAAVAAGDVAAYRRARMRERLAGLR